MAELLRVADHCSGYGSSRVLENISFALADGESVALLGRNGMGKTTLLVTLMGFSTLHGGMIRWRGADLAPVAPWRRAQSGLGWVPQERHVFASLSVEENLTATAANRGGGAARWTLPAVYALFPRLAERRRNSGAQLSGGEQQMLAIGRALMTNPKLLILDEATEGLAPLIRAEIWAVLARLKAEGQAILLIDKNLGAVLRLADRHVVMEKGRTVWTGSSEALAAAPGLRETYLHV